MQAITHVLVGIVIQNLCFIFIGSPFNYIFTVVFAFFSHFVVDAFAKITYHPPDPQKGDNFWRTWGIIMIIAPIFLSIWLIILKQFWFYFLGAFFSILVDIMDWGIIRPLDARKKNLDKDTMWHQTGFFHTYIDILREKILFWLPNWNYKRKGIIPEIILLIVLLILFIFTVPP